MSNTREKIYPGQIISQARTWVGTPYRHHGRRKGSHVDCIGLVLGVSCELGIKSPEFFSYLNKKYRTYGRLPEGNTLYNALSEYLPEYSLSQAQPGDVITISFDGYARHVAILTDRNTLIHAYAESKKVVENRWSHMFKTNAISAFRLREYF